MFGWLAQLGRATSTRRKVSIFKQSTTFYFSTYPNACKEVGVHTWSCLTRRCENAWSWLLPVEVEKLAREQLGGKKMQKAHTHIYIHTYGYSDMCIYIYTYGSIYIYISVIFFPLPLLALVVFSHAIRDNKSHQAWKLVGSELPAEELNNSRDCGSKSCPEATWLRTCVDQPTVFVKMSMMSHCPRIWNEVDFVQNGCSWL